MVPIKSVNKYLTPLRAYIVVLSFEIMLISLRMEPYSQDSLVPLLVIQDGRFLNIQLLRVFRKLSVVMFWFFYFYFFNFYYFF